MFKLKTKTFRLRTYSTDQVNFLLQTTSRADSKQRNGESLALDITQCYSPVVSHSAGFFVCARSLKQRRFLWPPPSRWYVPLDLFFRSDDIPRIHRLISGRSRVSGDAMQCSVTFTFRIFHERIALAAGDVCRIH